MKQKTTTIVIMLSFMLISAFATGTTVTVQAQESWVTLWAVFYWDDLNGQYADCMHGKNYGKTA